MMEIITDQPHTKFKMKKNLILIVVLLTTTLCNSQNASFPSNLGILNSNDFINNVVKINNFPFYADNHNSFPSLKNKRTFSLDYLGLNIQDSVPRVCLDDFRYGHKFDNPIGNNGLGSFSLTYWLPSNGNYLLFYLILDSDMYYFREFLVSTTLSGTYIDHLLVLDGWCDDPNVNFTQATVYNNLSITLYEIRNLNPTYVSMENLTTFPGRKVISQYHINSSGKFVLDSTTLGNQRTFNISELKGLISNISQ